MSREEVLLIINKIFKAVFLVENKDSLDNIYKKYAFDIKLPRKVYDNMTNEETYTDFDNATNFITKDNMEKLDSTEGFMKEKISFSSLEELINTWEDINTITTERCYNSTYVSKSDTIYDSENIFRSTDCRKCKNMIFSDGCGDCEGVIASQRTGNSINCIRVDDSTACSNSYNVICSAKIVNSYFIQDCNNLYECMFCSHISSRRFCIANMQFTEQEYYEIKKVIVDWILSK